MLAAKVEDWVFAMKLDFAAMNWLDLAERLKTDCRVVLPLGATEQHGYLSLATDSLVVDRITALACDSTGVVRAPVVPFGCSAFAVNYPGTLSLRTISFCHVLEDLIDCLYRQGFRRLLVVTGHGGNEVITGVLAEAQLDRPRLSIRYVDACAGIKQQFADLAARYQTPPPSHADWHEVFAMNTVAPIPAGETKFPDHPDFPPFPLNARTGPQYLPVGTERGPYRLPAPEVLDPLLEEAGRWLAGLLESWPKTEPES